MAILLNIDTATDIASVSIAENGKVLVFKENAIQKDHATFLHPAIQNILQQAGMEINQLNAIAVTGGPGSYTGLRVGMASAKGLCYALNKPFICINTLEAMALSGIMHHPNSEYYYCPMIDARRMEVFTALYKNNLQNIVPASAIILSEQFLQNELLNNHIVFFGSGAEKWKKIVNHSNCIFWEQSNLYKALAQLSFEKFFENNFTELAHSQPFYAKEFYNGG